MKLKIDTNLKVIQVEQQCKLVELFDFVKKIFPENQWKEYSIEAVPVIHNWFNPIYVPYTIPCYSPTLPLLPELPIITCGDISFPTTAAGTHCFQTN
jgi:hypothetical protein